jgi:hypothetical protein
MTRSIAALLAVLLIGVCSRAEASGKPKKEKTPMEWKGSFCAVTEPAQVVVKTQEEWDGLWKKITPDKPAPAADFTKVFGVAVFLGTKPTGGYGVSWQAAKNEITYSLKKPDGMVIQALTQPYAVKLFPKSAGQIEVVASHD